MKRTLYILTRVTPRASAGREPFDHVLLQMFVCMFQEV